VSKYTVAMFQIVLDTKKNVGVREYVIVDKDLSWADARKEQSANSGSWIYKQSYNEEN
jgi:hypothetical protein